jgi:hypothetical protein
MIRHNAHCEAPQQRGSDGGTHAGSPIARHRDIEALRWCRTLATGVLIFLFLGGLYGGSRNG